MKIDRRSLIDLYGPKQSAHLILIGILTGLAAGAVSLAYRYVIDQAEQLRTLFVNGLGRSPWQIAWAALGLLLIGLLIRLILKWEPMSAGSGVPMTKGELDGHFDQRWWSVLLAKFLGGSLAVLGGLSLGREGPTVQLGAMAGKGLAKLRHNLGEEHLYIACGVAAGLAASFNAPLAGIAFACEEVYRRLTFKIMIPALTASVTASILSGCVLGVEPLLHYATTAAVPMKLYPAVALLGLACGLAGTAFNYLLGQARLLYKRLPLGQGAFRLALPLALSLLFALLCPEVLGTGGSMLRLLSETELSQNRLALLLLLKFAFFVFCFCAAAPGGSFFPILVMGAYLGALCSGWLELDPMWSGCFILLGMAGFFSSAVGTPVTAIMLVAEMSGLSGGMLSYCVVSLMAFAAAHMLRVPRVKHNILESLILRLGHHREEEAEEGHYQGA